ncbi:translin [Mangifera indica]|uniref:translin n=1 Tax=Mangifera indica TaxID=29780 RepID=UPI001CFB5E24|nr:translin [Mangifera indica]
MDKEARSFTVPLLSPFPTTLLCKIAALRSFTLDKLQYQREAASGISSLILRSLADNSLQFVNARRLTWQDTVPLIKGLKTQAASFKRYIIKKCIHPCKLEKYLFFISTKLALRNAVAFKRFSHRSFHKPSNSALHFPLTAAPPPVPSLVSVIKSETFHLSTPLSYSSMADGGSNAPRSLQKQFEDFRVQLEESGSLRERIRGIVLEIESSTRLMHASLLFVHQSRPLPEVLEKPKALIDVLKELYGRLDEVLSECPGEYYRYHGDWRSETQNVVFLLAFMHWLETGTLLTHAEAVQKLGLNPPEFALDIEDYLIGLCYLSNEMPRYVVNQVLAGNYDCPKKVLNFLIDLHAAFRMLNLRNDFLRKKFDSLKYDLKRVEEVYYDMKIRHLANEDSTEDHGTKAES